MESAAAVYDFLSSLFERIEDVDQGMIDLAMTRARTIDAEGRAPIDSAWVPTFDQWIAAAEVAELLHLRSAITPADRIRQFTSEGSTFIFEPAATDWLSVAASLRRRSELHDQSGWAIVPVPSEAAPFTPRSELW